MEWCWDGYSPYPDPGAIVTDYTGQDTSPDRVLRGGAWDYKPENIRCADRACYFNSNRKYKGGFRLVRTLQ
jgi:formylglycine-generating enzyme required for sulfatase activity